MILESFLNTISKNIQKIMTTQILNRTMLLVPVLVNQGGKWIPEPVPDRTVGTVTYKIKRYRPRIEGLFARIERWTNQLDPADTFWRSISKDNITTWYGKTAESRIADPADTSQSSPGSSARVMTTRAMQ